MSGLVAHAQGEAAYLVCFGVGVVLSVLAFAGGFLHLHVGHWHVGGQGHVASKGSGSAAALSPLNGASLVAFLCWFGGAGYLLSHGGVMRWPVVLGFAVLSGLAGGGLVYWLLAKVLLPRERSLEPEDTPMVGVLGRVSAPVPRGGVGEMLYSQNGARRSMPVCAEDGAPIARDAEVVVLKYQRGVGYVRRWDELQQSLLGDDAPATHRLE